MRSLLVGAFALGAPSVAWAEEAASKAKIIIPHDIDVPLSGRLTSLFGLVVLMAIAWALSTDRKKVPWRMVGWGVGLQLVFGFLVLRTDAGRAFFSYLKNAVNKLMSFSAEGTEFLFGSLYQGNFSLVLNVLTSIIFFSSLLAVLYHLRVMHFVVGGLAWLMRRTLGTSGAESLSAAGNIFVGQTEAPLLVRPFVNDMTRSELMSVMTGGFATVAGGVLAAYVGMFSETFPDIAGHLITASVISAPAALLIAKLMVPEVETPVTGGSIATMERSNYANLVEAAAAGAADGLKLMANVVAMLLAFIALVKMMNFGIEWVGEIFEVQHLSLQKMFGWVMAPIAWVMGVPWEDCVSVGGLLGTKTVLNEFVAYGDLAGMVGTLQPRSVVIATYALCGFANFGSIAIQIGGISSIAPKRRGDLAKLGLRAMIGGTLAAFMTATVAGMLI